jgi:hypothetical protein
MWALVGCHERSGDARHGHDGGGPGQDARPDEPAQLTQPDEVHAGRGAGRVQVPGGRRGAA